MLNDLFDKLYKPDVLSCLADLSNDEVMTPPDIANKMLDLLPQELFSNPDTKILDPFCKSGVFLREAAKRFIEGEKDQFNSLQECIDHVFQHQLYGIAITELTSLLSRRSVYCSKYPNSPYSISVFDKENAQGNILYHRLEHEWEGKGDKRHCSICGASAKEFDRDIGLENHAYELIHNGNPEEIFNMKFDVIIGNPPYHLEDNGNGTSAKPIYHLFVNQAKKLNPKYLTMIIPARWYVGGKGLSDFRKTMLNDESISMLVDDENYKDAFPSVSGLAGGVCYFLRDRDYKGLCHVVNYTNEIVSETDRKLNEYSTFIRSNSAIGIVNKVMQWNKQNNDGKLLTNTVSSRKPFGLPTNYEPKTKGIPCQFIQRIGKKYANKSDVVDENGYLNKWKLIAPKAPIAGQTDFSSAVKIYYESNTAILAPGECCTESFIILGAFETEEECLNYKSYIFTKPVRYLLLQAVVSQDITKQNYCFVPAFEHYMKAYTNKDLYDLWGLTSDEIAIIESRIAD